MLEYWGNSISIRTSESLSTRENENTFQMKASMDNSADKLISFASTIKKDDVSPRYFWRLVSETLL